MNSFFECDSKSFFAKNDSKHWTFFWKYDCLFQIDSQIFFFQKNMNSSDFFKWLTSLNFFWIRLTEFKFFLKKNTPERIEPFFSHMTLRIHHFFENTSHRNQSFTNMTHKMKPFVFKMTQRIEPLSFLNMTQRLNWSSFEYYSQSSF